jgi:hypothetical protein
MCSPAPDFASSREATIGWRIARVAKSGFARTTDVVDWREPERPVLRPIGMYKSELAPKDENE